MIKVCEKCKSLTLYNYFKNRQECTNPECINNPDRINEV